MKNSARLSIVLLCAFVFTAGVIALAQEETKKTIKNVPITQTSITSGVEMFDTYCAVCHGKDGKGKGPAASEFKTPPSNLTLLSATHQGKFPEAYVADVIENGVAEAKAHGTKDMPVWGPAFRSLGDNAQTKLRVFNLTKYIESMQGK
jgi:mono/diheme cytochrome c family protein